MKFLLSDKVWTVVSQPKPEKAAERVTWEPKDLQAQNLIVLCVAESQLPILHDKETSKQMWDALQTIYEPHSLAIHNFIRRKLLLLKYSSSGELKEFFAEFDNLANQYVAAGGTLDVNDKVMMILEAKPEPYRPLITALELVDQLTV